MKKSLNRRAPDLTLDIGKYLIPRTDPGHGSSLAHELGHVAGYKGNAPDGYHDIDPTPEEMDGASDPLMGPEGGGVPSEQWCDKMEGLAQ